MELLCSAADVRGNATLGVSMRSVYTFGVGNDATRGCVLQLRRVKRADDGTTGVSLGVSGMMCTIGDVSVTEGTLGGSFVSDIGRLCSIRKNKRVVNASEANMSGIWCGILF